MEILFTPWRYEYITGNVADGCFFCDASRDPDDPERLVVFKGAHHLVMLNRHPYSNGHLMVAPVAHLASPSESSAEAQVEFWPLVLESRRVLEEAYRPHGFNLGMNLGRPAGAGVPDHYHFHVVPRWEGDTSFMSVVGGVRLVPEDLRSVWHRLRQLFARQEV
jgi:ATP adenylyltransferase